MSLARPVKVSAVHRDAVSVWAETYYCPNPDSAPEKQAHYRYVVYGPVQERWGDFLDALRDDIFIFVDEDDLIRTTDFAGAKTGPSPLS